MLAIEISRPGGPDVLVPVERPKPELALGEVLIKVEAAGVNRPDVMQRMGHYPPPPGASDVPGLEVAGVIVKIAHGVSALSLPSVVQLPVPPGPPVDGAVARRAINAGLA